MHRQGYNSCRKNAEIFTDATQQFLHSSMRKDVKDVMSIDPDVRTAWGKKYPSFSSGRRLYDSLPRRLRSALIQKRVTSLNIRQLRRLQKIRHAFLSFLLFSAMKCVETIITTAPPLASVSFILPRHCSNNNKKNNKKKKKKKNGYS